MCVTKKNIFVFTILLHTVSISETWQEADQNYYLHAHVSKSVTLNCLDRRMIDPVNGTNFIWRLYSFAGTSSPSVMEITKLNCPRCNISHQREKLYSTDSNGTIYKEEYVLTNSLQIVNLQPGDAGLYTCLHFDEKKSEYTDIVRYQLSIISKNDKGTQVNVVEGKPINFTCYTSSYFPRKFKVSWIHVSSRLRAQRIKKDERRFKHPYDIKSATREDSGVILCLHHFEHPYIRKFVLNVYFKPIVYFKNAKIQAHLNDAVILECMVEAFPWPKITWTRRGTGEVVNGSLAEYQYDTYFMQSIMRIDNVKKKDFGEFLCTAENSVGKSEVAIALEPYYRQTKLQDASSHRIQKIVNFEL